MQRLAAPMVGGMITAPLLSLFVLPAIYKLVGYRRWASRRSEGEAGILELRDVPAG
jgi:Cu(I)/Ag(I) efflux system membrane protein CusA/SilA